MHFRHVVTTTTPVRSGKEMQNEFSTFWPSYSNTLKQTIYRNPRCKVQFQMFQFPTIFQWEMCTVEFNLSGHAPFHNGNFVFPEKMKLNYHLHLNGHYFRTDGLICTCYNIQIPPWLAVFNSDTDDLRYYRFKNSNFANSSQDLTTFTACYEKQAPRQSVIVTLTHCLKSKIFRLILVSQV